MDAEDIALPRHDFYQTPTQLILSIYLKSYQSLAADIAFDFEPTSLTITLPPFPGTEDSRPKRIVIEPLFGEIRPEDSTWRVASTKFEIKLAKASPITWTTLLSLPGSSAAPITIQSTLPSATVVTNARPKPTKKNWDKLLDDELAEKADTKDPNAGGDAALSSLFSSIYANADPDTKKAMIKSYTESGGTTLSTDWSNIGRETTPIRPPEGMYPVKQ
ncbi:suppressor of G2 allele of SKP1, partial [Tremellales sp. Uapishka_1]